MSAQRFVLTTAFALLCAGWAQADVIVNGEEFLVNLNNPGQDVGGWGANNAFTDSVNTVFSTTGFIYGVCIDTDAGHPNGDDPDCDKVVTDPNADYSGDPSIRFNAGGDAPPFPTSFSANEAGGGILEFQNDSGSPYDSILVTTNYVVGDVYTCKTDIYNFCGFMVVHETNGPDQLEILFTNVTPEPSEYLFLLVGCAALAVVHRVRSRRASVN